MAGRTSPPSSLWLAQSVVVGLSCGVGYYLAHEQGSKQRFTVAFQNVKRALWNKNLWEATVPWWLVLACPSPWYPLALWFVVSAKQESDGSDDKDLNHHSDPFSENTRVAPAVKPRTAETRSDSLSLPSVQNEAPEKPKRYLEMLVHNVSHTDLVLSVNAPPESQDDVYCLCRPRFSAFDLYCRRILSSLNGEEEVVQFPRYERSETSPRYTIVTPKASRQGRLNTGLSLGGGSNLAITTEELPNLRFRGRDAHRIEPYYQNEATSAALQLSHAFFPLLATLLPRWQSELTKKYASRDVALKKVVVLVSGVGTPRNWTHSLKGNSTQACADLMEKFIHTLYPDVTVVRIHSDTNIFRYDENIVFVKRELMPCIDAYRDTHARGLPYPDESAVAASGVNTAAHPFSPDWRQSFHVTLSFADGSHARTHAIQTSLRPYRPTYFHLWQLKTFWHDTKIVEDDLEVHSFEDMETVPAVDVNLAQEDVKLVVQEMNHFRNDSLESLQEDNDITKFWLRKTRKPVLAVLLVSDKNGKPLLYRGTNMEVSMPTGSLCAERNVIGTALASNPALKREDLKMVAVLAVPLELVQQQQQQELVRPPNMPRSTSLASYSSVQEEETDWVIPTDGSLPMEKFSTEEAVPVFHVSEPASSDFTPRSTPPGTPVRRITLYSQSQDKSSKPTMGLGRSSKLKKTVLVHSAEDLNPLRPCGACNEWLKKIAESNPYFKVLTFTDADCNGVYASPCDE